MLSNQKAFLTITYFTVFLSAYLYCPILAFSQDKNLDSRSLLVGVTVLPPACMKTADGRWEGLSIEFWQAVSQIMGVPFEFREFDSLESLLAALEKKEIDVVPSLAVQDRFEATMDFNPI